MARRRSCAGRSASRYTDRRAPRGGPHRADLPPGVPGRSGTLLRASLRGLKRSMRSTSSTRPTSCSAPTTRRGRPSWGATGSTSRASPGSWTSCCSCSARRARRTSAAPRTTSSSRSGTTCSRATSRRPGCRPSCSPSSRSPRTRSGARARRLADGRVRGRRRDRRGGGASPPDPAVEQVLVCTPDKDMAQLVRGDRVVLLDRRRRIVYDEPGCRRSGACRRVDPRLARARRRLVRRLPGTARLGREVRRGGPRRGTARSRTIPARASAWDVQEPAARGHARRDAARALGRGAAVPRLARLRTADDGVTIRQRTSRSCAGMARRAPPGRPSATSGACAARDRPHRWRGGGLARWLGIDCGLGRRRHRVSDAVWHRASGSPPPDRAAHRIRRAWLRAARPA